MEISFNFKNIKKTITDIFNQLSSGNSILLYIIMYIFVIIPILAVIGLLYMFMLHPYILLFILSLPFITNFIGIYKYRHNKKKKYDDVIDV